MSRKGFSLVELIVVLVLISLSVALVIPSLSRFSTATELKAAAKKVSGILRFSRSEAINKGQIVQVLFNSDHREVRVQWVEEGNPMEKEEERQYRKTYFLPDGIQMGEWNISSPQLASDLPAIEFYPNGGSNGGTFLIHRQDHKGYRIKVDFLTGIVKIERIES